METLATSGALAAGGGAAALMLRMLWERFVSRSDNAERRAEASFEARTHRSESKLEALQGGIGDIKSQLAVLIDHDAFARAEFRRLEERLNGISANHGGRLAKLEADVVRLETQTQMAGRVR